MTNTTTHRQVPEALIDLIDAYAETRHRCGGGDPRNSRAWPKVSGVSRDEGHSRALLVFFAAEPTDDEMRAVHDTLAASPTPPAEQPATKETSGGFHVWRDISTAPKDGSRFVATGHNYGLYSEVRHTCVAQWFRGCWMEASDWNETSELKYLTHWMPLPPLPGNAARKQGGAA